MEDLICRSLFFVSPYRVSLKKGPVPSPGSGELLVKTALSSISAGTELLVYRNLFPRELPVDETIPSLRRKFGYPIQYGYAAVGRVIACGADLEKAWKGKSVFSFHPHESHFLATPEEAVPLPPDLPLDQAVLLPGMETAIHLLAEGRPIIGERVVVFGQGTIGLITTALLARMDLAKLITLDCHSRRREASVELGASLSLDPGRKNITRQVLQSLNGNSHQGADLVFELSGNPDTLNQAIAITGYRGRIVIGSFYGEKRSFLDLGGHFHRSAIQLISSQVSRIVPEISGSWTKARRLEVALDLLKKVDLSSLITHQIPMEKAQNGYRLLDQRPGKVIQILLKY